jgi:predicted amidohydrolase YtcJ
VTPAELIITGRVATLRGDGFGWTEGIAIGNGRVLAVGPFADLQALAGPRTAAWRLGPELVVTPALTDAHLHLIAAALAAEQPDLSGLDRAAIEDRIASAHVDRVEGGDGDGWLLGHGWSFAAISESPRAEWLDAVAPGRPIALWSHDHHSRWLSARAIQQTGLAAQPDPPGGRIERDEEGRPTGVLYETAAGLPDAAIGTPTLGEVDWAIGAYARELASLGVTSIHDPGPLAPEPALSSGPAHYRALAEGGHLPLRVVASVREEQLDRAIEVGFHSGRRFGDPERGRYRDGWLKLFSDGALGSRTAALLADYEDDAAAGPPPGGPRGMALRDAEQLAAVAGRAAEAGIASQIHAIGDAAVRTTLDVLAELAPVPGSDHRVEHAQLVDPADRGRFAQLGVAASVQPCHLLSDADQMARAWGRRTAAAFPLAAIERAGARLPFGTDAPVESADPWRGLAAAVTRRGAGWAAEAAFHPEQALSLERALRAACLDGPASAGISDEGHLGVGARADLLVLPAAAFDGPADPDVIAATRPLATLLDGVAVHEAPGFDP